MYSTSSVPCKRKRGLSETIEDTSLNDAGSLVVSHGLLLSSTSCTIEDMSPSKLTTYFSSLPERTQYFDFQPLITAPLKPGTYWESSLRTWREVGTSLIIERL